LLAEGDDSAMRIVLTGASGFLGRACLSQLREQGHSVVSTDRAGPADLVGDLSEESFCRTLPACDTVIHAAAVHHVTRLPLFRRRDYFVRNNVEATKNLCARYRDGSTHFVQIGTSMMYRQSGQDEYATSSPMAAQGVYSWSKVAAQVHVDELPNPTATVIPCIIGGRGREGLFRGFVRLMVGGGLVVFPGEGTHKIQMVHVDDVASLIGTIVERGATGVFNAAGPEPLTIMQWIDHIEDELHLRPVRRFRLPLEPIRIASALSGYRLLAREQLLMLAQSHVLSTAESNALGWCAKYPNARIVRDIARYVAST
jgi:nucleoside-diphosphate-sugar epimerase